MQTKPNPFKVDATDVPALMAAMLFEITTLRAEVRALTELVAGERSGEIGRVLLEKDSDAFEEVQERLRHFRIEIAMPPEG